MIGMRMEAQLLNVRFAPSGYPCGGLSRIFKGFFFKEPDFDMSLF